MSNYIIFLKKELYEATKTYRLLIMGVVFLIFGMLSPLTARFMPEILRWAMENEPSMAGLDINSLITQPIALNSWTEFFGGNAGMMGLIVLVIMFSSMLSTELSRGTLTIMLSKGLSRTTVVLSKFTSATLIWTGSYALSFLTAWGYTEYMFPGESVPHLFFAMFSLWFIGLVLLALVTLMATLFSKGYGAMLSTGVIVIVLSLINIVPQIQKYNPITLIGSPIEVITGASAPGDFTPSLIISGIAIVTLVALAVITFNKKKSIK